MTPTSTAELTTRRRWPLPQFSLAAILIVVTLSAVGLWYWYRVPFEVVHDLVDYDFAHDPLDLGGSLQVKQTETVHRAWGDATVRHGLLTTYDLAGPKLAEEEFREGVRDGRIERWYADGAPLLVGQFEGGQPQGEWRYSLEFDAREPPATQRELERGPEGKLTRSGAEKPFRGIFALGRTNSPEVAFSRGELLANWDRGLPDGEWHWIDPRGRTYQRLTFDQGRLVKADPELANVEGADLLTVSSPEFRQERLKLLQPFHCQFVNCPLKDVVSIMQDVTHVPLLLDAKRLEQAGVAIDTPINCRIENQPLIAALSLILEPIPAGIHYRYGGIWITSRESLVNWEDRTGVSQIEPPAGSALANLWDEPIKVDFVETPLELVCQYFGPQPPPPNLFDLSALPAETRKRTVTKSLRDFAFKDSLAILLDGLELKARLDGETIVIEPHAGD